MSAVNQQVKFTLLGLVIGCKDCAAGVSLPDGYREEDVDGAIDYILRDSHALETTACSPTPDESRAQLVREGKLLLFPAPAEEEDYQ